MKSFFRIFLLALCGAALIVACQQPGTTALSKGSLTITIGNKIAARTIAPSSASTTVTSYSITGTGPDSDTLPGQPIVVTAPTGSGSTTISSLPTGTWQINVTAYNANGDIIGTASQSVQVTIGQNSMTIPVGPVAGTGTLSVTVNLTGVTLASPSIHATLTPLSGQTTNTSLTAFSLSGSTLTSASTLENGYYILTTTLFDGTSQQAPPETELVWIVTSETSSQTYTYSAASPGYGTLNLTLTPLATPADQ